MQAHAVEEVCHERGPPSPMTPGQMRELCVTDLLRKLVGMAPFFFVLIVAFFYPRF